VVDVLGFSGGDYVNIVISQVLNIKGFKVKFFPKSVSNMLRAIENFGSESILEYVSIAPDTPLRVPSPYSAILNARRALKSNPTLLVLNDDIPKGILGNAKRVILYVHYPHLSKIKSKEHVDMKYLDSFSGRWKWEIHKKVFPLLFETKYVPTSTNLALLVNSTISKEAIQSISSSLDPVIVYPPVDSAHIHNYAKPCFKDNIVIYSGRIMSDKGIHDLILAVHILKRQGIRIRCKIIGPMVDQNYFLYLDHLVRKLEIQPEVEFTGLLSRKELLDAYLSASVYVHPSPREAFGISVVEAMAAGCVPVVRYGHNGPTLDIIAGNPEYGLTYSSIYELADQITKALEWRNRESVQKRALEFDVAHFESKISHTVDMLL
jgi:glycosyltransferase involved in cell wall biosynthesis